jgi:inner membrane protein
MSAPPRSRAVRSRLDWRRSAWPAAQLLLRHSPGFRPGPISVVVTAVGLAVADAAYRMVGATIMPGGALDELAHVLTTLLMLWALAPSSGKGLGIAALGASVAIDLDHVPDRLGYQWLTAGTARPYTHSLLTIALIIFAAFCVRRPRDVLFGAAFGVAVHLFRDLAEIGSGVSLLWPISDHAFSILHGVYIGAMAGITTVALLRASSRPALQSNHRQM